MFGGMANTASNLVAAVQNAIHPPQPFKEQLFGCMNDPGVCCMTFCCPCYQFGLNQNVSDGSDLCLYCCLYYFAAQNYICCAVHYPRRQMFRKRYNIKEDQPDLFVAICCSPWGICQEARELKLMTGGAPPPQCMAVPMMGAPPNQQAYIPK